MQKPNPSVHTDAAQQSRAAPVTSTLGVMRAAFYRSILLGLSLGVSACAWSRDLAGQWDLKIENREHYVVTVLVIEFTAHQVQTCGGGIWARADVVSATTEDSKFFPMSEPLSYQVENNRLVLDHGGVCDGGTLLIGALNDETIRGEYLSGARGLRQLGFFTLSKRK